MRIWSVHPRYLDAKGLIALWRETLLAKKVLEGKTNGYRYHPQLDRFKQLPYPIDAINQYLEAVYEEALSRNYNFNKDKISVYFRITTITVTIGQLEYETQHLLNKLKRRDIEKYNELKDLKIFEPHPMFKIIEGGIESWEIIDLKQNLKFKET